MRATVLMKSVLLVVMLGLLGACASVPMASSEQDAASKTFASPTGNQAGLYVFRNSFVGKALKKDIYMDRRLIGESADGVFFHRLITPGNHTLSTESEFSDNALPFVAVVGKNLFFRQYIKAGVFVGGANLEAVSEEEGMAEVLKCDEALGVGPLVLKQQEQAPLADL